MNIGDRVKARYEDAGGAKLIWDGVIKEQRPDGWMIDVGGIAILFNAEDIVEVIDGEQRTQHVASA